jgi:hypothetical protein
VLRAKYTFLHNAVLKTYTSEKSLLTKAKALNRNLEELRLESAGAEPYASGDGESAEKLRDELNKVCEVWGRGVHVCMAIAWHCKMAISTKQTRIQSALWVLCPYFM